MLPRLHHGSQIAIVSATAAFADYIAETPIEHRVGHHGTTARAHHRAQLNDRRAEVLRRRSELVIDTPSACKRCDIGADCHGS
jgi:hypothetical protein